MNVDLNSKPWVILSASGQRFGVAAHYVKEMVILQDVTSLPMAPETVRGMINLRGRVMPVLDLRILLGLCSASEEFEALIQTLNQREQDHKNWLDKLLEAVRNKQHFTGEIDPHKCAFGKWYDTFTTRNIILGELLKQFDAPHKAIHAVGHEANLLIDTGHYEQAEALVARTRNGVLQQMMTLFDRTRTLLQETHREIAVIFSGGNDAIGLAVDEVLSVEYLDADSFEPPPLSEYSRDNALFCSVARAKQSRELILLLDGEQILNREQLLSA